MGVGDGRTAKVERVRSGKTQRKRFQEEPRKSRFLVAFAPDAVVTKKEAVSAAILKIIKKGTETRRSVKKELVAGCQNILGWMARRIRWVRTRLMANITLTLRIVSVLFWERNGGGTYPAFSKISAARTTLLFMGRKAQTILIVVVTVRTIQKSKNRSERMNL
jgi:hypothetical protein